MPSVVFRWRMFVSITQRESRSSTSSSAGYACGSSRVVTIVTVMGRKPSRRTVRRTSRTVIDAGSAAHCPSPIHAGRSVGLKYSTNWSSGPSTSTTRDRGLPARLLLLPRRGCAWARPAVKSTMRRWWAGRTACRFACKIRARCAHPANASSPSRTSPTARCACSAGVRETSDVNIGPSAQSRNSPLRWSISSSRCEVGNPRPGRQPDGTP